MQCRHALHKAGGEAPQPAIAERCIRLDVAQAVQIDAKARQRGAHLLNQTEIVEAVKQQPADEEFK